MGVDGGARFKAAPCFALSGLPCEARRAKQGGGAEGSRTPDLVIANDALYQLSYGPPTPPDEGVQARARHKGGGEGVSTGLALRH